MTCSTNDNYTHSCGLYIINSGKSDSCYKIGITANPKTRLDDIRIDYDVPAAYYSAFVELISRTEAELLEATLHKEYRTKWNESYRGLEWFDLSLEDVEAIVNEHNLQIYDH